MANRSAANIAAAKRRQRLFRDLPRQLEAAEAKAFEVAKRFESRGYADRAAAIFRASRTAFEARARVVRASAAEVDIDPALDAGEAALAALRALI